MPHKFLNKDYATPLRAFIAAGKSMRSLIHFGTNQIFHGATTYTCILELQATPNTTGVVIDRIEKISDAPAMMHDLLAGRPTLAGTYTTSVHPHPINGEPWAFSDCGIVATLSGLPTLGAVAKIFVGIQTDADDVYYVTPTGRELDGGCVQVQCDLNERLYPIEEAMLRPLAEGDLIKAFSPRVPHRAVVFPFQPDAKGRWQAISAEDLASRFPKTFAFFNSDGVRERLKSRASGRLANSEVFWDFIYKKNLARQHLPKVCIPRLAERVTAALDAGDPGPRLCLDNVDVCGVVPVNELLSLELIVGLLNSRLLDHFMKASVRDSFRGGYLSLNKQYLKLLPVKLPTTAAEKALAERITASVRQIMAAKTALRGGGGAALSDGETRRLQSTVETHENRINQAVFALYGVDGLPPP